MELWFTSAGQPSALAGGAHHFSLFDVGSTALGISLSARRSSKRAAIVAATLRRGGG